MALTGESPLGACSCGSQFVLIHIFTGISAGSQAERMAVAVSWEIGKNKWARMATCRLPTGCSSQQEQAFFSLIAHAPTTWCLDQSVFRGDDPVLCKPNFSRGVIIHFS